jgi:hypothetical protein
MPKAGRIKHIKNPDNANQYIPARIVDELTLTHGQGEIYKKHILSFLNDSPNTTRHIHTKTITHKAKMPDGSPDPSDSDDPNQKVDVEIIDEFSTKTGRGFIYQKRIHALSRTDDDEALPIRKTHTVRIKGTEEGHSRDSWIDIKRTDEVTLKTGSGPTYNKEIWLLDWNDVEFDQADAPVDTDPDEGFDPSWRFDPVQEPVNIKWGSASLSLGWQWFGVVDSGGVPGESCEDPDIIEPGTVTISTGYDSVLRIEGPYSTPLEGVTVHGEPSISDTVFTFDPFERLFMEFVQTVIPAAFGTIQLQGILGDGQGPRCVAFPSDAEVIIGNIRGVYGNTLVETGESVIVDATGITADFDGSTWSIDHAELEAAPGAELAPGSISVTLFMKRD